jgi:hypothetical protein
VKRRPANKAEVKKKTHVNNKNGTDITNLGSFDRFSWLSVGDRISHIKLTIKNPSDTHLTC